MNIDWRPITAPPEDGEFVLVTVKLPKNRTLEVMPMRWNGRDWIPYHGVRYKRAVLFGWTPFPRPCPRMIDDRTIKSARPSAPPADK